MRIAIISHGLSGGGGISVGKNIIASLAKIAPHNEYLISFPADLDYEEVISSVTNADTIAFKKKGVLKRGLFDYCTLPKLVGNWKPDVVLGLGNMSIRGIADVPQAILCHNSYLWYDSKHYGRKTRLYVYFKVWTQKRCLAKGLRRAKLLLCQTESAAERIHTMYSYEGRTAICPNAVSRFTLDEQASPDVLDKVRAHQNCMKLFYLTKYYPHKNLEVLLDLYDRYREELSSTVLFLTIAADQHPDAEDLLREIENKGLSERIINLGPLPQESLGAYFRSMDALIMPTLLESFSGSYLEAMHYELPILTSDLDFAREVCGEAALYFDPWNVEDIKNTILKLKNNPESAQQMVSCGKTQLQSRFKTWDEIARQLLEDLREIAVVE